MSKFRCALAAFSLLGVGLTLARPAEASVTLYTDRTLFTSQLATSTSFNFSGITSLFADQTNPFTLGGLTFSSPTGSLLSVTNQNFFSGYNLNGDSSLIPFGGSPNDTLTVTTPGGVNAIGFDLGALGVFNPTESVAITLSDGSTFNVTEPLASSGGGFVGFIDTSAPISSVAMVNGTEDFALTNNYIYGTASPAAVPEVGSLVGMSLGLVALGGSVLARRRKK